MSEERQYTPFIYLATDMKQAAGDIIEAIGALSVLGHTDSDRARSIERMEMRELQKAADKVAKAMRNYEALIKSNIETVTREQYEEAAEVLQ